MLSQFNTEVQQPQWHQYVEAWNNILKSWSYLGQIRLNLNARIYPVWRVAAVIPQRRYYNAGFRNN